MLDYIIFTYHMLSSGVWTDLLYFILPFSSILNVCRLVLYQCFVTLTDVINFIVCCRFGEVHISVQPFLKFVAARESFRWLRFQLFP